ncbi:trp operon repressor [Patescibacteria group bacterium]|nr:trp operon repressor [Patescibacteria group bacterium]
MIVYRMDKVGELVKAFLKQKSPREMLEFLKGILTPKELAELESRLQIVKLIKSGLPHQEIARRLKVGVATVTRGSREIKLGRFRNI